MGKHVLHTVEIQRGHDVIVTHVPEHEIDVLRHVHGAVNVRVGDETDEHIELNDHAENELLRLQGKYRRLNSADPVMRAHPTGAKGLEAFGFARGNASAEGAPQSGNRKHGKPQEVAKANPKGKTS
jgi:hypothetical protein